MTLVASAVRALAGTWLLLVCAAPSACSKKYYDLDACYEDGEEVECSDDDDSEPTRESWAVGSWFSPAYVADGSPGQSPMGIGIYADGTWEHNTNGIVDESGTWSVSGDSIILGGLLVEQVLPNCTAFRWESDDSPWAEYYRDDMPEGCPETPEPLTPTELCLVGEFQVVHETNVDTGTFRTKRTEYRTSLFEQYWSDTQTSQIGFWYVNGTLLCETGTGSTEESCAPIDWDEVRSSRTTSEDPGCIYP
jgi:hypothetical protein